MAIQIHIRFKNTQEQKQIARLAKDAGLSISNWFRKCAGLEPLAHGGKRKRKKAEKECKRENCLNTCNANMPQHPRQSAARGRMNEFL
jgi:hypothetical protein